MNLDRAILLNYFGDEVDAIRLTSGKDPEERHIALLHGGGNIWLERREMVEAMRAGRKFYARKGQWRRELEIVHGDTPSEDYVRTKPDTTTENNLLSLPQM